MRIGSLCSGYGGLELGVQAAMGGETAWVSDIDKTACRILGYRFPDVPNIGDMTAVDWRDIEPVDLICGGTPCQDLSHAGRRKGMGEGTRSGLWVSMREAIAVLRPQWVVWENVGGAFSARADSDVEREPRLLGEPATGPALRAIGRVLGDLASLGYDARWVSLRASDVGATHRRLRVFILAADTASGIGRAWQPEASQEQPDLVRRFPRLGVNLPTPMISDGHVAPLYAPVRVATGRQVQLGHAVRALLPTPAVNDMGAGKTIEWWEEWAPRQKSAAGDPAPHGASLSIEAQLLAIDRWGIYEEAITRWEGLMGRPAPEPTTTNSNGKPCLAAPFVEWMMGLPLGWITDVPDLSNNQCLHALGNGVVPQQAASALHDMRQWAA